MAAEIRLDNEDFTEYRKRLKEEAYKMKEYLKGHLIWCSSIIVKRESDGAIVKVRAQGTYRKEAK